MLFFSNIFCKFLFTGAIHSGAKLLPNYSLGKKYTFSFVFPENRVYKFALLCRHIATTSYQYRPPYFPKQLSYHSKSRYYNKTI